MHGVCCRHKGGAKLIELFLVCLVTGIAAGVIGSSKGRSGFGYFLIGFFLNIIGVLIAIGVPSLRPVGVKPIAAPTDLILCWSCSRPRRADAISCPHCGKGAPDPHAGEKKCPACAEWIKAEAKKCRHCGEILAETVAPEAPPTMGHCPGCRKLRASNVSKCLYCGNTDVVSVEKVQQVR